MLCIYFFQHFDPRLGLKTRNGTDADRDNLRITLRQLDFDVSLVAFSPLNYLNDKIYYLRKGPFSHHQTPLSFFIGPSTQ